MNGQLHCGDCSKLLTAMERQSVDLVIGSPPYAEKGERYGGTKPWPTDEWIDWMFFITQQALLVSRNLVVWIVNGAVRDGRYLPACEGLVWRLHQLGITCERPAIWHKNAPPNRKDWFGNDWEFCLAFRPPSSTRYFNWEAIAQPPKYTAGGRFRQRTKDGSRRLGSEYPTNKLARPRDVLRVTVGGGHLGSKLSHLNEAPYPEGIVEPFVLTCSPPGGTVLDPFCGSGTTLAVAERNGRNWIGIDCRPCQVALSRRRIDEVRKQIMEAATC
jgi:site-specific DNA-methyltransferase (adenine-specific)/site-specific DNA-methyltransferase (cytosine-N4-specific)